MTRYLPLVVLAGLAATGLAGCQSQAGAGASNADDVAAMRAVEDEMRAAYKARDVEKLVATYAPDATIYVTSDKARVGTDAIAAGAKADVARPAYAITFTTTKAKVAASGDMGYTQGSFNIRYTNEATGQPTSYSGYYLTLFAKQPDGSWKAIEDMSTPAA